MFNFLTNDLATMIVAVILIIILFFIIRYLIKNKRAGKSGCGCDCGSCPYAAAGCTVQESRETGEQACCANQTNKMNQIK